MFVVGLLYRVVVASRYCCGPSKPFYAAAVVVKSIENRPIRALPPVTAMHWPTALARELRDMEFMQFHPTVLYIAGSSRTLVPKRREGLVRTCWMCMVIDS